MNERSIDMSQTVQPGAYRFGAEHFTPELQNSIVDSYFNGGDSVHSQIGQKVQELQAQQEPVIPQDIQQRLERASQLEKLASSPEFVKAYSQILQGNSQQTQTIAPQPNVPQPTQTEQQVDNDPFAGLFSNETQVNQTQNVAEQNNVNTQTNDTATYEAFVGTLTQRGIDPADFTKFMQELNADDLIGIYQAFKAQAPGQPAQPQPVAPEPPRSIQNLPVQNRTAPPQGVFQQQRNKSLWD